MSDSQCAIKTIARLDAGETPPKCARRVDTPGSYWDIGSGTQFEIVPGASGPQLVCVDSHRVPELPSIDFGAMGIGFFFLLIVVYMATQRHMGIK